MVLRGERALRSVQRHRGMTARPFGSEGRQPGGDRPFAGESRSALRGHRPPLAPDQTGHSRGS
jgi:hypothetical protein